jgi:hypothetical protein
MANEMNFFDEPPDDDEYLREASRRKIVPFKQPKAKKQTPEGLEWQDQWQKSDSGAPLTNHFNAMLTLRNHDALKDIIRHDEMAHATILSAAIPGAEQQWTKARPITDADVLFIQEAVQSCGLRRIAKETMRDAIAARAVESGSIRSATTLSACNGTASRASAHGCHITLVWKPAITPALSARCSSLPLWPASCVPAVRWITC